MSAVDSATCWIPSPWYATRYSWICDCSSDDSLIVFMRRAVPHYRRLRDWFEGNIESVETAAARLISKARFQVYGTGVYPDATFTLRMSYGTPKRYELGTTMIPYKTVFSGLFARAESFDGEPPFRLSPSVQKNRKN